MSRLLVLAGLVTGLLAPPLASAEETPKLDFVFYQPDYDEGLANAVRRQADLDFAKAHGVTDLVIQYVAHDGWSMLDPAGRGPAELKALLDEAHARGLTVWVGTHEDPKIWQRRQVPLGRWAAAADASLAVAREAAPLVGSHPAFAGWYWTPEAVWWDSPRPRRLEKLSLITQQATAALRELTPGKPVAVVLGPGGSGEGSLLGESWCRYIEAVAPDVVVVMDGVGSAHRDVILAPALYALTERCADRVGAELWADLELFGPDLQQRPTRDRRRAQYDAARTWADRVGAFDLNHWLGIATAGRAWLEGSDGPGRDVPVRSVERRPHQDWLARPVVREGTLEVELSSALQTVGRVHVVTRGVHPKRMSLSAFGRAAMWEEWGEFEPHHGPGRNEITWVWTAPGGPREASQVRAFLTARRFGMRVVEVRLFER
ncbi:MAG: DUF4434 domain-containing protein [Proteobacteria bacterium]|nr:DUF4434 domain-containing protein [Pseudomonadota bacterium]